MDQYIENKDYIESLFGPLEKQWHIKNLSLIKQGADRLLKEFPNYIATGQGDHLPSNQEIVRNYNFIPVYDCGWRKWRKKINE